jgi:hypothetical protein
MQYKAHRAVRTSRSRPRKYGGKCEGCGKAVCSCKIYQYVDADNAAISNNSPYLCKSCYEARYNVKIPSEVDSYRNSHIDRLLCMRDTAGLPNEKCQALDMLMRVVADDKPV